MSLRVLLQNEELKMSPEVAEEISCDVLRSFNFSQRCDYVTAVPDCLNRMNYLNYIKFFYCTLSPTSNLLQVVYAICLLSFCWILFVILGTTVFFFFIPALKVIAKVCSMSEHMAGATLMAFGDSTPDVLASLVFIIRGHSQDDAIYSDVISGILYVSIFISGLIIVLAPFEMQPSTAIRDVAFLLFTILYIDFAIRTNECMSIVECCLILSIYFIYLTVLIVDQVMLKRQLKRLEHRISGSSVGSESDLTLLENLREQAEFEVRANVGRTSRFAVDIKQNRKSMYRPNVGKNEGLFSQFFKSLNPFHLEDFEEASYFKKATLILRIPINFTLFSLLPVVDYELPQHGWSKLLNCIQIVVLPLIASGIIFGSNTIYGVIIWPMSIIITLPIAVTFFMISRTDIPPDGHSFLAFLSSAGSALIIYFCAAEVMGIFYVIGIVSNSSLNFLNITVISWGMAIGDLISNVSLALNEYQRMGYAACFGSSMFNCIFIIGGYFLYTCTTQKKECVHVSRGPLDANIGCFIILGLVFTLIWLLLLNCKARRCVGYFTIGIYVFFCVCTLMEEVSLLHSYADDIVFFPIL